MLSVPSTQTQRQPLRISTDTSPLQRLQIFSSDSADASPSPTNPSLTTSGTTPSTGNPDWFICHALCMYDFESPDPDHLSFNRDEVLTIIKQEDSGWWAAMRPQADFIGWIPSSFVEPLTEQMLNELQSAQDRGKVIQYQEETPRLDEGIRELNDPPRSASQDAWVPVFEDFKVPSLQLVTPTDLVSQRDLQKVQKHSHDESFFSLSDDERSPLDLKSARPLASPLLAIPQPPTPQSPAFLQPQKFPFLPNPQPFRPQLTQATQSTETAPSVQSGAAQARQPRRRGVVVDDRTSLLRLSTLLEADHARGLDLIDSPNIKESLAAFNWTPATQSQGLRGCRDNGSYLPSKGLPSSPRPVPHYFARSDTDVKIAIVPENDLITWDPDDVAEQFCVLMHDLYAAIRPQECLNWVKARTEADVANLRRFSDVHDQIATWVQKSVLSHDILTRRAETLDFWVHVAEKCRTLHNFDSVSAIVTGLTSIALSLLRSTWARCSRKQNFDLLSKTCDAANNSKYLMVTMSTVEGPCVPFVRAYLENIKDIDKEYPEELPARSDYQATVGLLTRRRRIRDALSTMLKHQASVYGFGTANPTRKFIDEQLQGVDSVTSSWLQARSRDIRQAELNLGE